MITKIASVYPLFLPATADKPPCWINLANVTSLIRENDDQSFTLTYQNGDQVSIPKNWGDLIEAEFLFLENNRLHSPDEDS